MNLLFREPWCRFPVVSSTLVRLDIDDKDKNAMPFSMTWPLRICSLALSLLLFSCAGSPTRDAGMPVEGQMEAGAKPPPARHQPQVRETPPGLKNLPPEQFVPPKPYVKVGSGKLVNAPPEVQAKKGRAKGDVTLNFESADLREVIKVVFEEILGENYLIDPKVLGVATIHTTQPIRYDEVLPVLEAVLRSNGATLVKEAGVYKVLPLAEAKKEVTSPGVGKQLLRRQIGYSTQIVPLQYVAASEIKKILESINKNGASVQVDETRNILILSGTRNRLKNLLDTIRIFDVDWLKGMSFALFPLQYADAKILTEEMGQLLGKGKEGPLTGLIKLIPIERLNAVLVITHRPRYLDAARELIEQFDRGTETGAGRRLYVYRLENGKAENIGKILQDIFSQEKSSEAGGNRTPSSRPHQISNVRPASSTTVAGLGKPAAGAKAPASPAATLGSAARRAGASAENTGQVTIIADQDNNAILILATPRDYRVVEAAIRRLDVAPEQVLIEATIAEVRLSNNLSYGVRWFFSDSLGKDRISGGFNAPSPNGVPVNVGGDGFTLGIFDSADQLRIFFDILETETSVKFLSAPQVMVVDNQTASIRVGDQIPIVTRSTQSTTDSAAPLVSEVQFRDTGTLLSVTPSINAGGRVTLEISQEVSIPGTEPAVGGGGNVPISQRTIDSTVMVHSGQTVVLGGLIRETTNNSKGGIPVLKDIPGLGALFSNTTDDTSRTELIVTITPRVVSNQQDATDITEEFRQRVKAANDLELSVAH